MVSVRGVINVRYIVFYVVSSNNIELWVINSHILDHSDNVYEVNDIYIFVLKMETKWYFE